MSRPSLTISSKNYGSWSLRGWLLCKLAGLDFDEIPIETHDPDMRAELLLLAPSFRVPSLAIDGCTVWGTLAIAEELNQRYPEAAMLPAEPELRSHSRSICSEMNSGFSNLRAALPMNVRARYENFPVWSAARNEIARICEIWTDCLAKYGGPFLFGDQPTVADAMYAPVCIRFATYGIELSDDLRKYRDAVMSLPPVAEWIEAAEAEPDRIEELDVEF